MFIVFRSLENSDSLSFLKFLYDTLLLVTVSFLTSKMTLTTQWSDKNGPGSHESTWTPLSDSVITRSKQCPPVWVLKSTCCSRPIAARESLKFFYIIRVIIDV